MGRPTEVERRGLTARADELLGDGISARQVAAVLSDETGADISRQAVARYARSTGQLNRPRRCLQPIPPRSPKADPHAAELVPVAEWSGPAADFDANHRIELGNRFAEVIDRLLRNPRLRPGQLQALAASFALLVDKRRLEDGEATARSEVSTDGIRERIAQRLDELATRRNGKRRA